MPSSSSHPSYRRQRDARQPTESEEPLNLFDKLLSVWILLAVGVGLGLSFIPGFEEAFGRDLTFGGQNILLAAGLIAMMIPPLMSVDYSLFVAVVREPKTILLSLVLNYLVGPILMFSLGYAALETGACDADEATGGRSNCTALFEGVSLIGIARCIAMVVVWVKYAGGDESLCALLVAVNSVMQLVLFAVYAFLFNSMLLPSLGIGIGAVGGIEGLGEMFVEVFVNIILIYLGIPFALALALYFLLRPAIGSERYGRVCTAVAPVTLGALLFTIVVMFGIKGRSLFDAPMDVLLVAAPLLGYFFVMSNSVFLITWALGYGYEQAATMAFTSAGNNFELALAVAIGSYGINSPQAFASVIGPLVEIPVMLSLIYFSSLYKAWLFPGDAVGAGDTVDDAVNASTQTQTAQVQMVSSLVPGKRATGDGPSIGSISDEEEWVSETCKPCPEGDDECPSTVLVRRKKTRGTQGAA